MDRKNIIAIGVCVLLLLAWFPLMRRLGWLPGKTAGPVAVESTGPAAAVPEPSVPEPPAPASAIPAATLDGPAPEAAPEPDSEASAAPAPAAQELRTPQFTVRVDPAAGGVTRVTLASYQEDDRRTPVTLGDDTHPFLALRDAAGAPLGGTPRLVSADDTSMVLERALRPAGLRLRERWTVDPAQPYRIRQTLLFENGGAEPVRLEGLRVGAGGLRLASTGGGGFFGTPQLLNADGAFKDASRAKTFTWKKIQSLAAKGETAQAPWRRELVWAALHTQYFVLYLAPQQLSFTGLDLQAEQQTKGGPARLHGNAFLPPLTVAPGASLQLDIEAYAGPKEYQQLRDLGHGAHAILQMDLFMFFHAEWMGAVSRVVLKALLLVQDWSGTPWGCGLGIILITVLVKILFWPLTHYTTVSMKKMAALQPQMQEIRKKYPDDPAKVQQKMMELYREHKVNPASGCVPMLLQIPVFFALFNVFRNAIELRHAPFLWVQDLSQPDTLPWPPWLPVRPFGLLSAVTMFLQQRLTPTAADPQQAKMMTVMTVFFGFLFYGMPSGLTLYWTVNQALSIVMMLGTHWWLRRRAAAAP